MCNFYDNDIMYADWIFVNTIRQILVQLSCVFEIVTIRDGLRSLSDIHFKRSGIYGAIIFLCTQ